MKIKLSQLASELRISERALIDWLARRGYSNARRSDWLSGQLARAARHTFHLRSKSNSAQGAFTTKQRKREAYTYSYAQSEREHFSSLSASDQHPSPELRSSPLSALHSFKTKHIEDPKEISSSTKTTHVKTALSKLEKTRSQDSYLQEHQSTPQQINRSLNLDEALQLVERERARAHLLQQRLEELRTQSEDQYHTLRDQHERVLNERSSYKRHLLELSQNHATLEQTCVDLSTELDQTHHEVQQLQDQLKAQAQLSDSVNQANQQKQVWRARALALEERVQSGQKLSHQLKELGVDTFDKQINLFQTLLSSPESAAQLFNAIKMVDREVVQKMVNRWVVPTCTHPLCNQTNRLRHLLSLRVDRDKHCKVCYGEKDRRWFQRMTATCERANIRRFLMIGAEEIHDRIRRLMEGQSVEFRLISEQEQSTTHRIQNRLESCDLLITWSENITSKDASHAYRVVAPIAHCFALEINGDHADITLLSRQILHWVSRGGGE